MSESFSYLSHHNWLVFDDQTWHPPLSADNALAYQDSFIRWISTQQNQPTGVLHFYPIVVPTVLIGAKDTRLPRLKEANQYLVDKGYHISLRSHGGLAVVCDAGVINIGIATDLTQFPLTIDYAYEQMVHLIQATLQPLNIHVEAYEVPDSYCPGTYDLVVNRRKIGGIAQRRFKNGITTAAYISVCGNQNQRANLIRQYYRIGQADTTYPTVNPDTMANITEFTSNNLSVEDFKRLILQAMESFATVEVGDYHDEGLQAIWAKMNPLAEQRSHSIQPTQFQKE